MSKLGDELGLNSTQSMLLGMAASFTAAKGLSSVGSKVKGIGNVNVDVGSRSINKLLKQYQQMKKMMKRLAPIIKRGGKGMRMIPRMEKGAMNLIKEGHRRI